MATNFPSSQDNFTNPTASDTLDSPDHAAQHTDVNDAVEAIELALLDGAPLKIDDANERVGIGTTTPSTELDVNGTVTATEFVGHLQGPTHIQVKNTSGGSLSKGTPVYATGSVGASGAVEVQASLAGTASTMPSLGLLDDTLASNAEGSATVLGVITQVDTSSYSVNDELYVAVSGGLTATRPTGASELVQKIGRVVRSDASTGEILVVGAGRTNDVPNGTLSNDISGNAATATTATSATTATNLSGGSVAATTLTASGDANFDSGTLFVDVSENSVGIGTTSPATDLHISAGSSGVTSQNSAARLIVEDSSAAGIAINTSNTGTGYVRFVDPDSNAVGGMSYAHTDNDLKLRTAGSDRMTIDSSGNVGIGTTSPSAELDVVGNIESTTVRITSTTDSTTSSTGHGLQIGGSSQVRIDDNSVMAWQTGTASTLHLQKYGSQLRIGNTTDADVYLNGFLQGHWTSYTPSLYTGNYSGSPTHTLGSAGSITARYCVWGNVVFVQMDVSYGTFTSGNSTLQPRFSVPSGLRVVPTRGIGNGQGDFMGVGNMSGYMTHDYIGAMMAFNDGQHSSNGFIQWTQADSSSAGGNYNAYDAMYSGSTYTNDDLVTAYGRIVMSGWYRTDAL